MLENVPHQIEEQLLPSVIRLLYTSSIMGLRHLYPTADIEEEKNLGFCYLFNKFNQFEQILPLIKHCSLSLITSCLSKKRLILPFRIVFQ